MEETVALLKSCIISKKGGVSLSELHDEFARHVGEPVPYSRLGFSTLREFLKHVAGLITVHTANGEVLFVKDSKITHIQQLIQRQKSSYLKAKTKHYIRFKPYADTRRNDAERQRNQKSAWYNGNGTVRCRSIGRREDRRFSKCDENFGSKLEYKSRPETNRPCTDAAVSEYLFSIMAHIDIQLGHKDGYVPDNNPCDKSISTQEEENSRPIVIESEHTDVMDVVCEPRVNGQQLIGDDFFLQIAIRNLNQPIWRYKGSLTLQCGLCVSGQTIRNCIQALQNVECISNRVIVMLGSVDVYNGATCEAIINDMTELLMILRVKFSMSRSGITLCTIPPLANLSIHGNQTKILSLYSFNSWVRSFEPHHDHARREQDCYRVIDLFETFTDANYVTDYGWFQVGPRMVSGCKHPYVLWNKDGRKRVMSKLCSNTLICKTPRGPYSLQRTMKPALSKEPHAEFDAF